eukprot:TRINITY_DN6125_c0_g1_i1.p1 TRINITY_DN6125_c0_g1~~TRINITY_DN6125_c0_g1_i1.p1  ORF type:complete len:399 (+),score=99.92 TRINITY_DN6125_c0_g1_i1:3-1199(+)
MLKLLARTFTAPARFVRAATAAAEPQQRTALYDAHLRAGGKMVPFAGWDMPVQYPAGVIKEISQCRERAALFDVSHMCQIRLYGKHRAEFLESLCTADLATLKERQVRYSLLTNATGGVIDDCIISAYSDHFYVVLNAGCATKDLKHLEEQRKNFTASGKEAHFEVQNLSLLALQGPKAMEVLQRYVSNDLKMMPFMTGVQTSVKGMSALVSRCGYTGEDGFEISVSHTDAVTLWNSLLSEAEVLPAGLGARDVLRLEAGLCLYGHELNESISPVEANLQFALSKRRIEQGGFLGSAVIQAQLKNGVARQRVGLVVSQPAPAREGTPVFDQSGQNQIGEVVSGSYSPTLKKSIAMAYIHSQYASLNTPICVRIRDKMYTASVASVPFVPNKYHRVQKK